MGRRQRAAAAGEVHEDRRRFEEVGNVARSCDPPRLRSTEVKTVKLPARGKTKKRDPSSPDWERASRLSEPQASLGGKGEGLALTVGAPPRYLAPTSKPSPFRPKRLSRFAPCAANAGSPPLPGGRGSRGVNRG